MLRLCVVGAGGRMGRAVTRLAAEAADLTIAGAAAAPGSPHAGRDVGELAGVGPLGVAVSPDVASALLGADVVIDFSHAAALAGVLRAAAGGGVAVVSGTTGLDAAAEAAIERAAARVPVLWAPNMSVGVAVLSRLVEEATRALGDAYDVEIVETHHNRKVDAPSGTAEQLLRVVQSVRPLEPRHGRQGDVGRRPPTEVGVSALRGGGVVGDHTVHFLGEVDRIEITHRAMDRDLFARGALRAARFLAGRSPGRYTLADVIADKP